MMCYTDEDISAGDSDYPHNGNEAVISKQLFDNFSIYNGTDFIVNLYFSKLWNEIFRRIKSED